MTYYVLKWEYEALVCVPEILSGVLPIVPIFTCLLTFHTEVARISRRVRSCLCHMRISQRGLFHIGLPIAREKRRI